MICVCVFVCVCVCVCACVYVCVLSLQEGQVLECSLINSIRVGTVPKVRPSGHCQKTVCVCVCVCVCVSEFDVSKRYILSRVCVHTIGL